MPEKRNKASFFNLPVILASAVFAVSAAIYAVSRCSNGFAEFWARYPSQWIRAALAVITNIIPFSLAEFILLSMPILAAAYIIASNRAISRCDDNSAFLRWLRPLVMIILILGSLFTAGFGPCYFRRGLADNIGLTEEAVTADDLASTAEKISAQIREIDGIVYDADGASVNLTPYSDLITEMNSAYREYCLENEYISTFYSVPKQISMSPVMTYTHISGVYSFFTGESNINWNYPDFILPFTVAHEMAHQRGIAREDEANFVAYLVCMSSENEYIRYSALTNMLQYTLSALYEADRDAYFELLRSEISEEIRGEFTAYAKFFEPYSSSVASEIVDSVNNGYLSSQGQSEGTASYGLVVDLVVAYYKTR